MFETALHNPEKWYAVTLATAQQPALVVYCRAVHDGYTLLVQFTPVEIVSILPRGFVHRLTVKFEAVKDQRLLARLRQVMK